MDDLTEKKIQKQGYIIALVTIIFVGLYCFSIEEFTSQELIELGNNFVIKEKFVFSYEIKIPFFFF